VNTAVDTARPAAVTAPVRPRHLRAMLSVARVEGWRLLRHPAMLFVLLVLCPLAYWASANPTWRFAVLYEADQWTQGLALILGGVAMIVGNLATTRSARSGADEMLDVLLLPRGWRTGAHLLALLPLATVALVLVCGHVAVLAALGTPVGSPSVFELLTGPVVVLICGAAGVGIGRVVQAAFVTPLLTVVYLAFVVSATGSASSTGSTPTRFLPIMGRTGGDPLWESPILPPDLFARPAGWHLLYLTGILGVVAAVAVLLTRQVRRTAGGVAALVVAVLVTGAAGVAQSVAPHRAPAGRLEAATETPAALQTCQAIGTVTYCAFDGFEPWIPEWDAVVRGVLRRAPRAVADRPLAVRQRIDATGSYDTWTMARPGEGPPPLPAQRWAAQDRAAGLPPAITVPTMWGNGYSETGFAARIAYELVTRSGPGANTRECGARGVLVGWLAGQATPLTRTGLDTMDEFDRGLISFGEGTFPVAITLSDRAAVLVRALLTRPGDEVAARVSAGWDELAAPDTTVERAAQILGLPAPGPSAPANTDDPGAPEECR
jgi:hypothetical protein